MVFPVSVSGTVHSPVHPHDRQRRYAARRTRAGDLQVGMRDDAAADGFIHPLFRSTEQGSALPQRSQS